MNLSDYWNESQAELRPGWESLITWDTSIDGAEVGRVRHCGTTYVGYAKSREDAVKQIRTQVKAHLASEAV